MIQHVLREPTSWLILLALAAPGVAPIAAPAPPSRGEPTPMTLTEIVARLRAQYPGELLEAELEVDDGLTVYEVEVRTADGGKMELVLDAYTGHILEQQTEQDEAYRLRSAGTIVALEQVVADAELRFGARFLEAELEEDDGHYRYEIELVDPRGRKLEVTFDAETGELIEVEDD